MLDRTGQQIGNYRLLRRLGTGGFANVYLGEHMFLQKGLLAIKVLHDSVQERERSGFLKEARTIEALKHSHIVQVLDFGIENLIPYLVMGFAPNGTLRDRHLRGSVVGLEIVVGYVKQIAEALQYAHEHKVIHRDLKPENLLISEKDSILLSDFGIAVIAHESGSLQDTPFAGTLPYVSPEQIQGRPRPASDQYSLGIIVYEWLTGKRPFGGTPTEIVTQHLTVPPRPLREVNPGVPSAIEAVVMRALLKEPSQRYASVLQFAEALEKAASVVSAPTLYPTVIAETVPVSALPATKPASPVEPEPLIITASLWMIERLFGASNVSGVDEVHWSGNFKEVLKCWDEIIGETKRKARSLGGRGLRYDGNRLCVYDEATKQVIFEVEGETSVSLSDDGRYFCSEAKDDFLVRDLSSGEVIFTFKRTDNALLAEIIPQYYLSEYLANPHNSLVINEYVISPDGMKVARLKQSGELQVLDFASRKILLTYVVGDYSTADFVNRAREEFKRIGKFDSSRRLMLWSADSCSLALESTSSQEVVVLNLVTMATTPLRITGKLSYWLQDKLVSETSRYSTLREVAVWDATTGERLVVFWIPGDKERPTGSLKLVDEGKIIVWRASEVPQLDAKQAIPTIVKQWTLTDDGEVGANCYVVWSPDGTRIAAVYYSKSQSHGEKVVVWDIETRKEITRFSKTDIESIEWLPDGKRLTSRCGHDTFIWDAASGNILSQFPSRAHSISPDGKLSVAGDADGVIRVWNSETGDVVATFTSGWILPATRGFSWSPDSHWLLHNSGHGYVEVWDIATQSSRFGDEEGDVLCSVWSPDCQKIAFGYSLDGVVRVKDIVTGNTVLTYQAHYQYHYDSRLHYPYNIVKVQRRGNRRLGPYNWVEQLAWSPDGSSIVSIDAEDEIHLWDVNSGKTLRKWNARKVGRYHFCSPDTHIVVSASSEELTMHFWRMNTGEEFFACEHESGDVPDLVWSPMSKHIASTKGNIVYLWQVS